MTGGRVVVLGPTGRNFGAGMSGGIAYAYDPEGSLPGRTNPDLVALETLDADDRLWLSEIVGRHRSETGSAVADRLLDSWDSAVTHFVKVMPRDYRRVLEVTALALEEGRSVDEAVMAVARG
jgi:glutamate synthase (NADPH/NADH) large chain